MTKELDTKYGFRLAGIEISQDLQEALLAAAQEFGRPHPLYHRLGEPDVLHLLSLHYFDIEDGENVENLFGKEFYLRNKDRMLSCDLDDFLFINRLNQKLKWKWADTEISKRFQEEIFSKLTPFIKKVTRVIVLALKPDTDLALHKERMYYHTYENFGGTRKLRHFVSNKELVQFDSDDFDPIAELSDTTIHGKQKYLGLRLPLTTVPGDNGNAIYKLEDVRIVKYDAENNAFFMNEIEIDHGVIATPFVRGVVYIDAELDMEKINAHEALPFTYEEVSQ